MNTCVQQPRSIGYQHQSPPTKAHECNMVELEGKSGDAPVLPSVADSSLLSEVSASRPDAPMTDAAASTEACMESVTDGYFASMLCDQAIWPILKPILFFHGDTASLIQEDDAV